MTAAQKTVEVRISKKEFKNQASVPTIWVLRRLKEKGVPVIGKLIIQGVSHGSLEMFCEDGDLVYRWTGVADQSDEDELI